MDERSFDARLRLALMDANLERFRPVLDGADRTEPAFSHRYLRQQQRLLADPLGWARRTVRPLWKKALQSAACVLLACAVTLGGLMAVSPTVRAAVLNWLREISGNTITYFSPNRTEAETLPSNWRITWLPEGWELQEVSDFGWKYREAEGRGSLQFACFSPSDSQLTTNVSGADNPEEVHGTIQIQGHTADYYVTDQSRVLVWENEVGYLLMLRGDHMDEEPFLKIAGSIAFYEGTDTAYEMGWVPVEYEPMYRDELIGAAEEAWTYNQKTLLWQYVTDPVCPFAVPGGEPEPVTVNGLAGRFWAAERPPEDSPGTGVTTVDGEVVSDGGSTYVGDDFIVIISSSTDKEETAVLLWTDPETSTTFLLKGALSREDLLRMAESVTEKEPQPKKPSQNMMITSGTAYDG